MYMINVTQHLLYESDTTNEASTEARRLQAFPAAVTRTRPDSFRGIPDILLTQCLGETTSAMNVEEHLLLCINPGGVIKQFFNILFW